MGRFGRKIANKLAFGYLMIAVFTMLLIGALFIQQFRNFSISERQKEMTLQACRFAENAAPDIINGKLDSRIYKEVLASFASAEVILTDKEGKILELAADPLPSGEDSINDGVIDIRLIKNVLEGKNVSVNGCSFVQNDHHIIVGAPVYEGSKEIIGSVFLIAPIIDINAVINKVAVILIALMLAASILSGILGMFFSNYITEPIKLMNQSAIEMAEGNYSIRTNIEKKDELGQLAGSIDTLAARLGFTLDQLFQEKNKLNDLFSSISEGILAFDPEMNLTNYNESIKSLFQFNWNDDISLKVAEFLKEKGIMEHFQMVQQDGQKRTLVTDHGTKRLRFITSPVGSNLDKITGVVSLIQDISETERLEQMRKEFVANISHELRTPLTLIRGSLETILDGMVTDVDGIQKNYNRILRETAGMERLISDLQDLSTLQSGKMKLQLEKIDLSALVIELTASMQSIADKKSIKIKTSIIEGIPLVLGDYDRLRQLLVIFIDNSLKYSNAESAVEVEVTNDEKYVYIRITDHGLGIPSEDLQNIWDRFYKVDKSRNKANKGSGLGLAIARQIINLHKGVVRLESSLGKGTMIEVGLPLGT